MITQYIEEKAVCVAWIRQSLLSGIRQKHDIEMEKKKKRGGEGGGSTTVSDVIFKIFFSLHVLY